jgi:hypothetical protein
MAVADNLEALNQLLDDVLDAIGYADFPWHDRALCIRIAAWETERGMEPTFGVPDEQPS